MLGAFSTFSGVMLEATEPARDAQRLSVAADLVLQDGLGSAALYGGLAASPPI